MKEKKRLIFILAVLGVITILALTLFYTYQKDKSAAKKIDIEKKIPIEIENKSSSIKEVSVKKTEAEKTPADNGSLLERLESKKGTFEKKEGKPSKPEDVEDKAKGILEKLQQKQEEVSQEEPLSARVFKVKKVKYEDSLPVTGDIKSSKEIKMRFEREGVIDAIKVKEGDIVKKGDLIATIDKRDALLAVARAQSKFDSDNAALAAAGKELELTKILYDKGAIVDIKMEEVKLRVESERGKAKVSEEELKMAKIALEKTELRAYIDGIIGAKEAEEGEFFTPRDIVVNLLGIKDMYVEVGIVERDIHKLSIGQKAIIKVDAYPNREFKGQIGNLYPVVEGRSRTMKAEVKITDILEGAPLLPGMFAQVEILLAKFDSALMVPTMGLLQMMPDTVIVPLVVLDKGVSEQEVKKGEGRGKIKFVEVKTGYVGPDYTQIISGLKESDLIIMEAHGDVTDGRKIRILGLEEYGVGE